MENSNKSCLMCGAIDSDGIILNGEKICRACEEKIVRISTSDPEYDDYKDKVKVILFDEHAKC